jgi:penicillin-binding protein 1A
MAARLSRTPRAAREPLQGALVTIEPATGFVKAMVGGRDFYQSPFNRALHAKRQPGSAFKPFIFAMALESGYAPSSTLDHLDEPIDTPQGPWLPGGEHETTAVRLREALVVSSNRAAAHLMRDVGIARTVDLVHRFGVRSEMPRVPSLALGTGEMSLFELTSAYSVFANRGVWREPTLIRKVVDRHGKEIYRATQVERPVITEATAYLMSSMMADVVNRGTASNARAHGFRHAAAGKTGTSQSYADAWFVGYTPHLVTGVWFGHDTPQTIMNRGFASVVAVPTWARFMAAAHKGMKNEWFEMPGSVTGVKLCRLSGQLATDRCRLPVIEPPAYDAVDPLMAVSATVHEGGVYEELRHVTRQPELCALPHGTGGWHEATAERRTDVEAVDGTREVQATGGNVILTGAPGVVPASMRPRDPAPVLVLEPGATAPRTVGRPSGY